MQLLKEREGQVYKVGEDSGEIACSRQSLAGSVSQRACVFCGSRVVLYPIADAVHLVHGPIGCAAYTWDIRGSLSSGPELHRMSFSTDLRQEQVIFGGAGKLEAALNFLIEKYHPAAAFVYSTCIVGLIGDDAAAICRRASAAKGIPVLDVQSEGFKGTKKDGYKAACDALGRLMQLGPALPKHPYSINILGDFNLAGETWIIQRYYECMGVSVVAAMTGDGRVEKVQRAPAAELNLVQCAGSMTHLALWMKERYGTPFKRVSYFGIEDMAEALYSVAEFFHSEEIMSKTRQLVREELNHLLPSLEAFRKDLNGKRAAIYVGGAFKAHSLVKALRHLGMKTVVVGSQTGTQEDYQQLKELCNPGTVLVDDTNPVELFQLMKQEKVDLLIGGIKERPIAYKMGIGFCDHNHERKIPLAGFEGMLNFAREVHSTVMSPVWRWSSAAAGRG